MVRKFAIFAFKGEAGCFAHALLNALDLADRGHEVRLVIEGQAVTLVEDMAKPDTPFHALYAKVIERGLLHCVCRACAAKLGGVQGAQDQGLHLCDEMKGHPSMGRFLEEGYEIITI